MKKKLKEVMEFRESEMPEFRDSELPDKANHFTDIKEAVINSLDKVNPVTWYVEGQEKMMFLNGRLLTIVEGNGTERPFKQAL